ncbi:molybdate ABC transporter substrate-binding protein [Pendulispora albinea]|uniref:Molybdate ABC transporter substrate-binding protein n=1 Tax=Pendulispora albinea TaxID=2741071 RepID=A0ABZ2LJ64_9BACT
MAIASLAALGLGCQGKPAGAKQDASEQASSSAMGTERPLKVAAAADLARAFEEVGKGYEGKTGKKVVFSFGSSGLLAKQIAQGAPFDVFASANQSFADEAIKSGACFEEGQALYARGRLVVWTKKGKNDKGEKNDGAGAPQSLADLKDPRFAKVAIANPEHAPYGRAAKEALTAVGAWDAVSKKVVYGENIQQTFQFVQSGNAEAAVVALSLAIATDEGDYVLVDPKLHAPLDQKIVVCKGGSQEDGAPRKHARAFAAYVNSEEGRAIMRRFGFLLPGESLTPPPGH